MLKLPSRGLTAVIVIIFTSQLLSCIKKGRDEVNIFLNSAMRDFLTEEKQIVEKYNSLITQSEFKSGDLYKEIKKSLLPSLAALRTKAENYRAGKTKLEDIKKLLAAYVDKLDFLMEGLSKIEIGLLKNDFTMVNKGKNIINDYKEKHERFKEYFRKFLNDYNIKIKNRGQ